MFEPTFGAVNYDSRYRSLLLCQTRRIFDPELTDFIGRNYWWDDEWRQNRGRQAPRPATILSQNRKHSTQSRQVGTAFQPSLWP